MSVYFKITKFFSGAILSLNINWECTCLLRHTSRKERSMSFTQPQTTMWSAIF